MRRPILVVENDEALGAVIGEALGDAGYETAVFGEPESALRYLETDQPALVLSDLGLGPMDGWEFIERIRQRLGDELPVVVMTGKETAGLTLRPPARGFLPKPFELDQLMATVARWARDESAGA